MGEQDGREQNLGVELKNGKKTFPEFVAAPQSSPETQSQISALNTLSKAIQTIDYAVSLEFPLDESPSPEFLNQYIDHDKQVLDFYETIRADIAFEANIHSPPELSVDQFRSTAAFLSHTDRGRWECSYDGKNYHFLLDDIPQPITIEDMQSQMIQAVDRQTQAMISRTEASKQLPKVVSHWQEVARPTVSVKDDESELMNIKLRIIIHELGTALGPLNNYQLLERAMEDFPDQVPEILEFMRSNYDRVHEVLEDGKNILSEKYLREPLTQDLVIGNLHTGIQRAVKKESFDVRYDKSTKDMRNTPMVWDRCLIQLLGASIGQNVDKAYKDRKSKKSIVQTLTIRSFEDDDFNYLGIADRGDGYKKELLEQGFVPGLGGWRKKDLPSTRVGMSTHRKMVQDIYGGDIYPTNITDDKGNILGGEVIIKLPKVSKS